MAVHSSAVDWDALGKTIAPLAAIAGVIAVVVGGYRGIRARKGDAARADREITRGLYLEIQAFAEDRMHFIDECMAFVHGFRDDLPNLHENALSDIHKFATRLDQHGSDAVNESFAAFSRRHAAMFDAFGRVRVNRATAAVAPLAITGPLHESIVDADERYGALVESLRVLKAAMRREQKVAT